MQEMYHGVLLAATSVEGLIQQNWAEKLTYHYEHTGLYLSPHLEITLNPHPNFRILCRVSGLLYYVCLGMVLAPRQRFLWLRQFHRDKIFLL